MVPAAVMWWWINNNTADIIHVGAFWMLYIWLGVVPLIGMVFGRTGEKVEKKGFWNGSTLKMTLCITPLLLFLICHTRIATRDIHGGQISEWSTKALMNLFDGIELVGVILDENECNLGIPKNFKNTLIAFTCISFLWWPIGMAADQGFGAPALVLAYDSIQQIQLLFDTIFLALRLGLCLGYGRNVSIFMSKNIIFIAVHSRRIFNFCCGSDDSDDDSTVNQQQAESSEPSMPAAPPPAVAENTPRVINVLRLNSLSAVAPLQSDLSDVPATAPPERDRPPPYNPRRNVPD